MNQLRAFQAPSVGSPKMLNDSISKPVPYGRAQFQQPQNSAFTPYNQNPYPHEQQGFPPANPVNPANQFQNAQRFPPNQFQRNPPNMMMQQQSQFPPQQMKKDRGRTLIPGDPIIGTIKIFSEKGYGFIEPLTRFNHIAMKGRNSIFLHSKSFLHNRNIEFTEKFLKGKFVYFQCCYDEKGVSARNVILLHDAHFPDGAEGQNGMNNAATPNFIHTPSAKILIEKSEVAMIIGRKGENVKRISRESKCKKVHIEQGIAGNGHEVLCIYGDYPATVKAAKLLASHLATVKQADPKQNQHIMFLIPQDKSGLFIGKQGATIKTIQGNATPDQATFTSDHIVCDGLCFSTFDLNAGEQIIEGLIERTVQQLVHIQTGKRPEALKASYVAAKLAETSGPQSSNQDPENSLLGRSYMKSRFRSPPPTNQTNGII